MRARYAEGAAGGGIMKKFTDDQVVELNRKTLSALKDVAEAWKISMRGLRINSREYKQLCRIGRELQDFHHKAKFMAEQHGIEENFDAGFFCSFN